MMNDSELENGYELACVTTGAQEEVNTSSCVHLYYCRNRKCYAFRFNLN